LFTVWFGHFIGRSTELNIWTCSVCVKYRSCTSDSWISAGYALKF